MAWNAVQKKGFDSTIEKADSAQTVDVALAKPLGIEFVARKGGGVLVEEVRQGYSAAQSKKIKVNDYLAYVNDVDVRTLPFDDAIQQIMDAEGLLELKFIR